MNLKSDIINIFKSNMVNSLIVIIVVLSLIFLVFNSFIAGSANTGISEYIFLSSDYSEVLKHFWVLITHLFIDQSIYNLIWNMLILYWFGYILGDLIGDDTILPAYLFTGLSGAALFFFASYILHFNYYYLSGVRTSTIGVMMASAFLVPDYNIRLILLGNVKLKFVALAILTIDLLFLFASNDYSYWAIIGATIAAWLYIKDIRSGKKIKSFFNAIFTWFKSIFAFKKIKTNLNSM
ncbi:MAG: rhomboid family intramembrane serine protease [Saprospiraceae bacterium]